MVTIKIDELIFKNPVKEGNIIKVYASVKEFGRTSVTIYMEVRKHNVYTGVQEVVVHTEIKFVRIDEEGNPIPISERVKKRYFSRIKQFGKGLLSLDEMKNESEH
jgi:acyl-CoA thioesterase YciA